MLDRGVCGGKECTYDKEERTITCASWLHGSITVQILLLHFDRIILATKAMNTLSPIFDGSQAQCPQAYKLD